MESVGEAFESARLRLIEAMVAWMKRETSSVQTLETLAPLLNAEVVGLEMFGLVKACCAWVTYVTVKSSERTTDYPSDALRTILAPLWHYHRFVKEVFPIEWKGGSPRSELDQDEEELDMHAAEEEEEESSMSSLPRASLGDSTLSAPIIVSGSAMDLDYVKKDAVPTARLYHGPNLGWSVVRISMCHSEELRSSYIRPAEKKTEEERSSVTVPMEMTSVETTTATVANVFPAASTNAKIIATSATANSAPLVSAGLGLSVSMRGKPSLGSSTLSNLLSSSSSSSSLSSSSSSSSLSSSSSSASSASLQTASSTNTVDPPTLADLSETWRLVKNLVEPILIDRGLVLWMEKRVGFALVAGGAGGEAPEVSAQSLAAMYGLVLPPGFASLYEATKLFKDHIIMDADFIKDNVETIVAELAKICEKELETICEAEHIAEDPLHVGAFGGSSRLSARKKDCGLDGAPRSGEDGLLSYAEEEHAAETHTVPRILLSLYACVLFLAIDLAALPHSDTASYKGECLRKRLLLKDGPHTALRLWFMPPAAQSYGADGSDLASLETVDPVWLWRSLKRFGKRLLGNDPSAALVLFHVDHRLMSTLGYRCYQEAEADGYAEDEEENVELDESSHGLSYDGEELCEDSYNNEDYETYHHEDEFEEAPEVYDYEAEEAVVEDQEKEEPDCRAPLLEGGHPTNAQLMESIASLTAKVSQLLEPQAEVERCQEEASSGPSVAQVLDAVAQVNTQVAALADSLNALNNRVIVYEGVFQQWAQLIKCRQADADAANGNPADEKQF